MDKWGKRKDGRPYRKQPKRGIRPSDLSEPSDSRIIVPNDNKQRKMEEIKKEKKLF